MKKKKRNKQKDVVVIPLCIGHRSPEKAKEMIAYALEIYKESFPGKSLMTMPYRDSTQFHYPIILKK